LALHPNRRKGMTMTADTTTDQQRIAELPELPEPFAGCVDVWPEYTADMMHSYALAVQAPLIERIKELEREIARLKDPKCLVHRGNSISLNCKRSTIDLFVSRAIENKDTPNPSPEQVAAFWKAVDAALTQREEDDEPCSFCFVRGCNGECSGDGAMGD
jgi:hypothetical protein